MTVTQMKHFLLVPVSTWGHLRPQITMAARILKRFQDVQITALVGSEIFELVESELSRFSLSNEQSSRLHLIKCGPANKDESENGRKYEFGMAQHQYSRRSIAGYLREFYPSILAGEGDNFKTPPKAVLIDMAFLGAILNILEAVEKDSNIAPGMTPKRILFTPVHPAYHDVMHFDTAIPPVIKQTVDRVEKGEDPNDVFRDIVLDGKAMAQVPGMAPMYAYELDGKFSVATLFEASVMPFRFSVSKLDGVVSSAPPCFTADTTRLWAEKGVPLFSVGPIIGPSGSIDAMGATYAQEIKHWLDEQREKYGAKSVAYVCFGSMGFTPSKDQTVILLEALRNRQKPALIISGGADDETRALLETEMNATGGLIKSVKRAPQQAILAHPATGFFLNHGGQSSTVEAISADIPTIIWQGGIDQVYIANQMSQVFHAAIELVQIRGRHNFGKTLARGGVVAGTSEAIAKELRQAFADVEPGSAVREELLKNIAKLKKTFEEDLRPGGRATQSLERFVHI